MAIRWPGARIVNTWSGKTRPGNTTGKTQPEKQPGKHNWENTAGSALTGNTWGGKTRSRHIGGADARIREEFGPGKTGRGSARSCSGRGRPDEAQRRVVRAGEDWAWLGAELFGQGNRIGVRRGIVRAGEDRAWLGIDRSIAGTPGWGRLARGTPVIRHPAAARSGRNTLAGVNRVQLPDRYESSSLTLAEISLPSARPASFFEAAPITLPISFIDVAPTSAITALTSAVNSSGVS